jgi:integrase/recombinase XerD
MHFLQSRPLIMTPLDRQFEVKIFNRKTGIEVEYLCPLTKKRKRIKKNSKKEARELKFFLESKYHQKELSWFLKKTLSELIDIYLEQCPDSQIKKYSRAYREFYERFKHYKLNDLSSPLFQDWFYAIKKQHDYSDATVCNIKNSLNSIFVWLKNLEIIQYSPMDKIKLPRSKAKKKRVVHSKEEIMQILQLAQKYKKQGSDLAYFYPMLYAIVQTGARLNEMICLKWSEVSFSKNTITFLETKNGLDREISMSEKLREHLLRIRKETEYVFTDCFGEKLNKGKATRHMREFVLEHKLSDFAFHSFRHSYTYHSIRSGKSLAQIQANLGHKRIETTINIYGNIKAIDDPTPSPYEF